MDVILWLNQQISVQVFDEDLSQQEKEHVIGIPEQ